MIILSCDILKEKGGRTTIFHVTLELKLLEEIWDTYKGWGEKFLPDDIFRAAGVSITFEEKLQKSFPFQSTLIDTFYNEWGTHVQFLSCRVNA